MTNKEKSAEEWANKRCPESGPEFIVWQMCKEDYLGGYERGQEILREEFNTIIKKLDGELRLWQTGQYLFVADPRPQGVIKDD